MDQNGLTERQKVIAKIRKVQALAKKGAEGEQQSAAAQVDRMMKKYGLSEADLETEQRERAWFRYQTQLEMRLLQQVIYSTVGDCDIYERWAGQKRKRVHKVLGVDCTAAERVEIGIAFDFWKEAMETELARFFHAFVCRNQIFPPPELAKENPNPEPVPIDEAIRLNLIMSGMDAHTRRRELPDGGGGGD